MKALSFSLFVAILISSCTKQNQIVKERDYSVYLNSEKSSFIKLNELRDELNFWNKRLMQNPNDLGSQVKIGGLLNRQFSQTGNIQSLSKSDSIYLEANKIQSKLGSNVYRSLAANCVTQHKFIQAMSYLDSAAVLGDNLYVTKLMQVDVAMELGNLLYADQLLFSLKDKNSFDYLIRESKLSDKKGDLGQAILIMEKAFGKIMDGNDEELYCWTKSNLADMYGHDNRIKESYAAYLDVLKINPTHYHSLKGIAWIAFSHDHNTVIAKEILSYLVKVHPVPDYYLKLAEIASFENNTVEKENYLNKFYTATTNKAYGAMYARYNFFIVADEFNQGEKAMEIAKAEVKNRPTTESYNLLAWAKYKTGDINEALEIIESKLENKSSEPDVLYHMGMIFAAAQKKEKAKEYLSTALESSFELGPAVVIEIRGKLNNI